MSIFGIGHITICSHQIVLELDKDVIMQVIIVTTCLGGGWVGG